MTKRFYKKFGSFCSGVGSCAVIVPKHFKGAHTKAYKDRLLNRDTSVQDSIKRDWQSVGDDLWQTINEFARVE